MRTSSGLRTARTGRGAAATAGCHRGPLGSARDHRREIGHQHTARYRRRRRHLADLEPPTPHHHLLHEAAGYGTPRLYDQPVPAVRTVLSVVGARPNFMKIAPIVAELQRRGDEFASVLVHTGQHYDDAMSSLFLERARRRRARLHAGRRVRLARPADGARDGAPRARAAGGRTRHRARAGRRQLHARGEPGGIASSASRSATSRRGCGASTGRCRRRSTGSSPTRCPTCCSSTRPRRSTTCSAEGLAAEKIHRVGNTMIDTLVAMSDRIDAHRRAQRSWGWPPADTSW